jgi:septal ring factor EnvC (AmiA/AmiB activator)
MTSMIALMQNLSTFAGFISVVLLLAVSVAAGKHMARSNINSQASEAQKSTIEAMNVEISVLRTRIDDIRTDNAEMQKENARLQLTMNTISAALRSMNLIITVEGEMVIIRDGNSNNSTVTRIHSAN